MKDDVSGQLLEYISTVTVAATTQPIVCRDYFLEKPELELNFEISYLGDNFHDWFLNKVEKPFGGSRVCARMLKMPLVDAHIITEIGGKSKVETTLAEVFSLMAAQPGGESGSLFTNGSGNIFYVPDHEGELRSVSISWDDFGWSLNAYCIDNPFGWESYCLVFSRQV